MSLKFFVNCFICFSKSRIFQYFKKDFLNFVLLFTLTLCYLTFPPPSPYLTSRDREIKRQRHKICPLLSSPPGFCSRQPDLEDVILCFLLLHQAIFSPIAFSSSFFILDLGDIKKVIVFIKYTKQSLPQHRSRAKLMNC